jgi:hypothetical protein
MTITSRFSNLEAQSCPGPGIGELLQYLAMRPGGWGWGDWPGKLAAGRRICGERNIFGASTSHRVSINWGFKWRGGFTHHKFVIKDMSLRHQVMERRGWNIYTPGESMVRTLLNHLLSIFYVGSEQASEYSFSSTWVIGSCLILVSLISLEWLIIAAAYQAIAPYSR